MKIKNLLLFVVMIFIVACGSSQTALPPDPSMSSTIVSSSTLVPTNDATLATIPPTDDSPGSNSSATPTFAPGDWKNMPIVPVVSEKMKEVYLAGLAAGRNPAHFSKIGDCQNITTYFLAVFDDPSDYRLGSQYASLQSTINHFSGSWSRQSLAVRGGLNVAAALNPLWADPHNCIGGETPIACELRVYNPSIVTVSMEESWSGDLVHYNLYLRQIVNYILSQNVVPILATRAEVPGSKNDINSTVARIAYDYQVPLWNFWAATINLPSHGLTPDGFHLTQAANKFDDHDTMEYGWPWRNLTALETIDAVYQAVSAQP